MIGSGVVAAVVAAPPPDVAILIATAFAAVLSIQVPAVGTMTAGPMT